MEQRLCKWTVIVRPKGYFRNCRQRFRRFLAPDNFDAAKKIALTKCGDHKYEGLYRWSDKDYATALRTAKEKLALSRKVRALVHQGLTRTAATQEARKQLRIEKDRANQREWGHDPEYPGSTAEVGRGAYDPMQNRSHMVEGDLIKAGFGLLDPYRDD